MTTIQHTTKIDILEIALVFLLGLLASSVCIIALSKLLTGSFLATYHFGDLSSIILFALATVFGWVAWRFDRLRSSRLFIGIGFALVMVIMLLVIVIDRALLANPASGASSLYLLILLLSVPAYTCIAVGYVKRIAYSQSPSP